MEYKGYTATVEVDLDAGILYGYVLGLTGGIDFQTEISPMFAASSRRPLMIISVGAAKTDASRLNRSCTSKPLFKPRAKVCVWKIGFKTP